MNEAKNNKIDPFDDSDQDQRLFTAEIGYMPAGPGKSTTPEGPIDHDLPCKHCGYNLRGMTVDRACPECGTAVGRSLLGDRLRFSDPKWVRTLANGAKWILWSVLIGITIAVVGTASMFILMSYDMLGSRYEEFMILLLLIPSLIFTVGVWFITSREPDLVETSHLPLRVFLRWFMVASLLLEMVYVGIELAYPYASRFIGLTSPVLGLTGYIALSVFARRLALRVPDYDLASHTRTVMWGISISLLFIILFMVIEKSGLGLAATIAGFQVYVLGLALLVLMIWSLVLLIGYRRLLHVSANDAEQAWAIAPGP